MTAEPPRAPRAIAPGAVAALFALLCAGAASLGQAGRVSDRADAINFGLPYLIGIAATAALVALLRSRRPRRWPAWCAVAALALLVTGPVPLLVAQSRQDAATVAGCDGPALRLVTFNAWDRNATPAAAASWLRLARADVVVIEEVAERVPAGPSIASLVRDAYPFQQGCADAARCSTMILARRRPVAGGGLAVGDPENRRALSAAWLRPSGAGPPFMLVGVHLGRPWPWPRFDADRAQLAAFVARQDPRTAIVAGDLNLPGWTFQMRALERALKLRRVTRMLPSWPAVRVGEHVVGPLVGLDHILVGRDWRVTGLARGPFLGSDHYPVIADLRRCADQD